MSASYLCVQRVYQNRLKLVEIGQSNTAAIILLKTGMVFPLKVLSKWKLMNDFFCKTLLIFVHLKKDVCYFKDFFPPRKSNQLLLIHWHS